MLICRAQINGLITITQLAIILQLWQGNMDIQPCSSNKAIDLYIAEYLSKSKPTKLNPSIFQSIRKFYREESNISIRLFKILIKTADISLWVCI